MPIKVFNFKLPIKNQGSNPILSVVQGDVGGNKFVVSLTDNGRPFDLSGATSAKYTVLKEDNTVVAGASATIEDYGNGKVGFVLTDQAIAYPGTVQCQIEIYTGSVRMSSTTFAYEVTPDLLAQGDPASSTEFPILQQLIIDTSDLEEAVETAEAARVLAESGRIAAENTRVTAESARISAETTRTTAESGRVSAESARVTSETNRTSAENARSTAETARLSAETTRISNESGRGTAESARDTSETNRASAESIRVTNENSRITAESGRVTAENNRVTVENARAAAETGRTNAEGTRASNETTRQNNESTRQTNETTRESERNAFKVWETYNPLTTYQTLNKVVYSGSSYESLVDGNIGVTPGTDPAKWLLIAAKGSDGAGGDMFKGTYDTNNDGQVDAADTANAAPWAGITGKPDFDATYVKHSLATAVNDFLVASGVGAWVKKTVDEVKTILGLGSAAYTNSTDYATAAQGVKADAAETPAGAQAKVDALAGVGNTKTVKQLDDEAAAHTADNAAHGIVATAAPNKVLQLDSNSKLPASITGDAVTIGGLYFRNNAGSLEWSTDNATWSATGGSNGFEFGLPIL